MLITKDVTVIPHGPTIKRYKNLGYDAKGDVPLTVDIKDLASTSNSLVDAKCDYCGKIVEQIKYRSYNENTKNGTTKFSCHDCSRLKYEETMIKRYGCKSPIQVPEFKKKIQETNMDRYGAISPARNKEVREKQKRSLLEKYGVEYTFQSEEIRNKVKQTNLERYGVENVSKLKEVRDKVTQTNLERYGVENVLLNPEIRERRNDTLIERFGTLYPLQNDECLDRLKNTNMEKYGVENVSQLKDVRYKVEQTNIERYGVKNVSQSEEIKEKIKQTNIEKYGVESLLSLPEFHEHSREVDMERYGVYHHLQNPDILAKQKNTFYKNSTCPTSNQQRYINQLYLGILNYPVKNYNVDIYLPEYNLVVEYDGGGHGLGVIIGHEDENNHRRKEIIRSYVIKQEGYKQMRIISSKDVLPSDSVLLNMLEEANQYFYYYPKHSWIEYDVDISMVRNAEHKEGMLYNFGKLRKISKSDIKNNNINIA